MFWHYLNLLGFVLGTFGLMYLLVLMILAFFKRDSLVKKLGCTPGGERELMIFFISGWFFGYSLALGTPNEPNAVSVVMLVFVLGVVLFFAMLGLILGLSKLHSKIPPEGGREDS